MFTIPTKLSLYNLEAHKFSITKSLIDVNDELICGRFLLFAHRTTERENNKKCSIYMHMIIEWALEKK